MSKFKVGDRVRVIHDFGEEGSDGSFLGQTGRITKLLSKPSIVTGLYSGVQFVVDGKEYPAGNGDYALEAELELVP